MPSIFKENALLIHVDSSGTREEGFSSPRRVWIRSELEIEHVKLPVSIRERLRLFWHSGADILNLDSSESAFRIIVERVAERRSLIVFGAGHVGRNIAMMGVLLGFEVTLLDDREEFLAKDRISDFGICTVQVDFAHVGDQVCFDRHAAVVIVTRGHQCDEAILRQVAEHEVAYVGMIGSGRRVAGVFRRLREVGVSQSFLDSVRAPIGLAIGARSPQEIAVAVHAEIIKQFTDVVTAEGI